MIESNALQARAFSLTTASDASTQGQNRQQLPMLKMHFGGVLELLEVHKLQKKTLTGRVRTTATGKNPTNCFSQRVDSRVKYYFSNNNMQSSIQRFA